MAAIAAKHDSEGLNTNPIHTWHILSRGKNDNHESLHFTIAVCTTLCSFITLSPDKVKLVVRKKSQIFKGREGICKGLYTVDLFMLRHFVNYMRFI